ncbi:MAG TPA: branched-chain amino acid ABC transporter permease [Solirubrobacterales bacterium]|nr:branched-chain amino acid ABC transporter permease [Solirubrobacterales bacterium]
MGGALPTVLVNTVIAAMPLALIAVGFNLTYSLSGAFNVAHIEFATFGGVITYWVWSATHAPIYLAAIVAMLAVGGLAVLMRRTIIARLLKIDPVIAMIGTFALATTLEAFVRFCEGSSPRSFELPLEIGTEVLGVRVSPLQIRLVVIAAIALSLYLVMLWTPFGRRIRAVASNPELAEASGLRTGRIADGGWFVAGALAALAGVIIALTGGLDVTIVGNYLLPAFAAAIVGGLTSLTGAIGGALFVTFVEQAAIGFNFGSPFGTSVQLPVSLESAAVFLVLVLVLVVRPGGLFSRRVRSV